MKKLIYSVAIITTSSLIACGGSEDKKEGETSGPTVCDCVNMDAEKADDKMKEACHKMEQEWKDKFEKADDAAKEEMMKEIEACDKK